MIKYIIALLLPIAAFAERFEIICYHREIDTISIMINDNDFMKTYYYEIPRIKFFFDEDETTFVHLDVADVIFRYLPKTSWDTSEE